MSVTERSEKSKNALKKNALETISNFRKETISGNNFRKYFKGIPYNSTPDGMRSYLVFAIILKSIAILFRGLPAIRRLSYLWFGLVLSYLPSSLAAAQSNTPPHIPTNDNRSDAKGGPAESRSVSEVVISRIDASSCVVPTDLSETLSRGQTLKATTDPSNIQTSIALSVSGTPSQLAVSLKGRELDIQHTLKSATCETATEVVAAFVQSTLSPPPPVNLDALENASVQSTSTEASGTMLSEQEVLRIVEKKLVTRAIDLKPWKSTLTFHRDSNDDWFYRLTPTDIKCIQSRLLGRMSDLSEDRANIIIEEIKSSLGMIESCMGKSLPLVRDRYRETTLEAILRRHGDWTTGKQISGAVTGTIGVVWTALLVTMNHNNVGSVLGFSEWSPALLTLSEALIIVGGFGSFFVPEDYRASMVESSAVTAAGGTLTGMAASEPDYRFVAPLGIGTMASGLLVGANALIRRPPVQKLRKDYESLRSDTGAPITTTKLDKIESDLHLAEDPMDNWVAYSPMIVGSLVSGTWVLATSDGREGSDVVGDLAFGLIGAAVGCLLALQPTGREYSSYQKRLRNLGIAEITLAPGPSDLGGLSLVGRF